MAAKKTASASRAGKQAAKAAVKRPAKAAKGASSKAAGTKITSAKGASTKGASTKGTGATASQVGATRPADTKPIVPPDFVVAQLERTAIPPRYRNSAPVTPEALKRQAAVLEVRPTVSLEALAASVNRVKPAAAVPVAKLPTDIRGTLEAAKPQTRQFHGSKFSLAYFPPSLVFAPCGDRFGYMSSSAIRTATRLPFDVTTQALVGRLGALMADAGRETGGDSSVPAGFTYVGQFVDHDITLDVSSSLEEARDATTVPNMRTPALDLDSLYGRGPALDPFLYAFPSSGPDTAFKLQLGSNTTDGDGGPAGSAGNLGAMVTQTNFDVPRIHNPANPAAASLTAVIGDPRNDENLIVVQFHHAMLRFHNAVVDLLLLAGFTGDIFVEAKRIVTHHYQWAVVHDFLGRVCGTAAVNAALASVSAPVGSAFRMPVEFAVAAYRFGHSMVRPQYWVNFNFPFASLAQIFEFNRKPHLPVRSTWVVDFNAFFETGVPVPIFNQARKIDSVLPPKLEALPGFTGLMAILATRNLRRALALGLPSGQGMAGAFGVPALTAAQLTAGLPAPEVAVLNLSGGLLLQKTPLWYYVLREAAVLEGGHRLGPVGARIVAETFVRILKRDANSYLNVSGGFAPMLPSASPGDFTFADLVTFAGVTQP